MDTLTVKGRAPKKGYDRDAFGHGWVDVDRNGCGTRDDILKRDLTGVRYTDGHCKVASGTLTDDPYTGTTVAYVRGRSKVDIDHVVALSDAWQKGAQQWNAETRRRFANDPSTSSPSTPPPTAASPTATPRPGCRRTARTAARTRPGRSR